MCRDEDWNKTENSLVSKDPSGLPITGRRQRDIRDLCMYLINEQLSEVLCSRHDLGKIEDAFGPIDVTNVDSFDRHTTRSQ